MSILVTSDLKYWFFPCIIRIHFRIALAKVLTVLLIEHENTWELSIWTVMDLLFGYRLLCEWSLKCFHPIVVGCHHPWAVVRLFNTRCTLPNNNGTKCFTSSLPIWFIHGKWIFNLIIVHFHGSNAHFILNLRCVEWKCQSHSQYSI